MDVKERILDKATDLFLRYGIRSITMDEIATQLGISKKTIYQFFTDKDDMVSAVIEREMHENEEECASFRKSAENAVHQIIMAQESAEEILRSINPLIMYDLEKHHPRAYKRVRDFKNQFLYQVLMDNMKWGIGEGIYRSDVDMEIAVKSRIENAFLVFNPDVFPHSRYKVVEVDYELAILYLHSIVTEKGKQLIEKYTTERNKKTSHEQKV